MKKFIFMEKNGIYIIDLNQTLKLMESAEAAAASIAARGDSILFVGTKKQARDIIKSEATRSNMPYVCERWLGGMLTNFQTMRKSIKKLEAYEKKVVDGTYDSLTKKERLSMDIQRKKLEMNLGGIRHMKRLPAALFIVDTLQEDIAVREARNLGLPIFAILDTNSDPDYIDFPIPANDDAYKSIGLITKTFTDAVIEGLAVHEAHKQEKKDEEPKEDKQRKQGGPRRRRGAAAKRS